MLYTVFELFLCESKLHDVETRERSKSCLYSVLGELLVCHYLTVKRTNFKDASVLATQNILFMLSMHQGRGHCFSIFCSFIAASGFKGKDDFYLSDFCIQMYLYYSL